ncbi:MAG: hypothetical protein ACJ8G4_08715 [Burkholderiales bacterium]
MTPIRVLLPLAALVLSACSSSYRVVQVPQYGADLYPQSQSRSGIIVAIDEMKNAERVERLFGADLIKEGILPVNVVVSNFGKQRLLLKPSDILFYQGSEVIDPLPVEMVMATAKRQKYLRTSTERQVDKYFGDAMLKETVVYPNQTYRGVMFFAMPTPKRPLDRFFISWSILRDDGPKMRIGVTNLDTGERVLFSPFSVRLPDTPGAFSY